MLWPGGKYRYDGGLGSMANTNPGNQNARFVGSVITATRPIKVGDEIFVAYRGSYRFASGKLIRRKRPRKSSAERPAPKSSAVFVPAVRASSVPTPARGRGVLYRWPIYYKLSFMTPEWYRAHGYPIEQALPAAAAACQETGAVEPEAAMADHVAEAQPQLEATVAPDLYRPVPASVSLAPPTTMYFCAKPTSSYTFESLSRSQHQQGRVIFAGSTTLADRYYQTSGMTSRYSITLPSDRPVWSGIERYAELCALEPAFGRIFYREGAGWARRSCGTADPAIFDSLAARLETELERPDAIRLHRFNNFSDEVIFFSWAEVAVAPCRADREGIVWKSVPRPPAPAP